MRNKRLDAVKAISAYFVVLLHIRFPGRTGEIVNVLARFAVPLFFLVSGYFCYSREGKTLGKLPGKIKHILGLMLLAYPFYIVWQCIQRHIVGKPVASWLKAILKEEHIKEFFLYNSSSPVKWHLWFLPALLYCYLLFALVERFRLHKIAYLLIPVLLLGHFWMEEACAFTGNFYRTMEFRNYLYTGFPFFMLGHWIHKEEETLRKRIPPWGLWTGVFAGGALSVAEYMRFGLLELFTGSVILAVSVFLLAVLDRKEFQGGFLSEIGSKYTFFIYLFHLTVADVVKDVAGLRGVRHSLWYVWTRPLTVCVLTTVLAVGISALRHKLPVHLRKNVV